jgi:hypothetical protein
MITKHATSVRKLDEQTIRRIKRLSREGKSIYYIAKQLNIHPSTAYKYLHKTPKKEQRETTTDRVVRSISYGIAEYIINITPTFIADEHGNVRWPEAFQRLKEICKGREPTIQDVLTAINDTIETINQTTFYEIIEEKLPARLLITFNVAFVKSYLKLDTQQTERLKEFIKTSLMQHPRLARLLTNKEKLLNLITEYIITKLKTT